jgi:hypothetical protein
MVGKFRRYGMDHVVVGFWYAFARAVKLVEGHTESVPYRNMLDEFKRLALSALGNFKTFDNEEAILEATFALIQDSEAEREFNGFTGFRIRW